MTIVRTKHPKFSCTESKNLQMTKISYPVTRCVSPVLFLQTPSGECGYKFTADNNAAEVVDQDRCQSRIRVAAASHLTPPFSLLFCKSDPRFCRCWTFGCHSCLHKNNNNTQKNTRDLHDAHFRSLPTYFALASAACVTDCSNLIGLVKQIKVTAEFPDVHVPTDVSALRKHFPVKVLAFENASGLE